MRTHANIKLNDALNKNRYTSSEESNEITGGIPL